MHRAVITGGAKGIGLGIAKALADRGAALVIADIDAEAVACAVAELESLGARTHGVPCDVIDDDQLVVLADRAWDELGQVDLFFDNAGVMPALKPFLEWSLADADWVIDVNLRAAMHALQIFGRRMVAQTSPSRIVVTGSEHSTGTPHIMGGPYTASKQGILGLCDVVRRELPDHVGLSVLMPGVVQTSLAGSPAHRQKRYGGPLEESRGAMINFGPDADSFGANAVERVMAGDDFIVSHPHIAKLIAERAELLEAAVSRAMPFDNPDQYDMRRPVERMFEQRKTANGGDDT
ncbi:SDR family oxidoreductase [Parasphingopyxis sp.]|uniref:SDR family NAD(P)-dependent oxidoreductase n=1 Tax=Parasphingopyxis sp. TaxID=1920299 RepID=UPI0032EE3844